MGNAVETRERLVQENPHFRRLVEKHQELDRRLGELRAQRWLSEDDQLETVRLKKMKLALKDEMEKMIRGAAD